METVKAFSPVSLEVKLAASRPEFTGLGSEGGILVLWMVGGRASGRGRSQHAGGLTKRLRIIKHGSRLRVQGQSEEAYLGVLLPGVSSLTPIC